MLALISSEQGQDVGSFTSRWTGVGVGVHDAFGTQTKAAKE